jgi:NADH-quinone oxidoreductase subunit C
MSTRQVITALGERFPEIAFDPQPLVKGRDGAGAQICVRVDSGRLVEVMTFLRDDPRTHFEQLSDLTCVDYLHFAGAWERFGVTYSLLSLSMEHRLWAKCFVNDPDPEVPSLTRVWKGADWLEREIYDMFGIRFVGHPDLRRLLTWDGFEAYPLRKDYPLRGRGERASYEVFPRDVS